MGHVTVGALRYHAGPLAPPRNTEARNKALEALRAGATVTEAARVAGVSRAALHQWAVRGDEEVKAAMARPTRCKTAEELGRALGMAARTVRDWTLRGLPRPAGGWDPDEVREWARTQGLEPGRHGKPPRLAILAGQESKPSGPTAGDPIDDRPPAAGDTAAELLRKEALAKAKKEHWKAAIDRLKALQLEGVLVHRDEVTAEHAQMVQRARARLLALPGAVAAALAAETDARKIEAHLDSQIRLALEDLSAVPE